MKTRYFAALLILSTSALRAENFNSVNASGNISSSGGDIRANNGMLYSVTYIHTLGYAMIGNYLNAGSYITAGTYVQAPKGSFNTLGIGTLNPAYLVDIIGNNASSVVGAFSNNANSQYVPILEAMAPNLTAGNSGYIGIGRSRSSLNEFSLGFYYAGNSSSNNRLDVAAYGSTPLMSVLASGNVGIGTSAPTAKLEVNGDVKITGAVTIQPQGDISMGIFGN